MSLPSYHYYTTTNGSSQLVIRTVYKQLTRIKEERDNKSLQLTPKVPCESVDVVLDFDQSWSDAAAQLSSMLSSTSSCLLSVRAIYLQRILRETV